MMRIAVVQSRNGRTACAGPHDFREKEHGDAMQAATCYLLDCGEIPAAFYWIEAALPPPPTDIELVGMAERGEFPKPLISSIIERTDDAPDGPGILPADFGRVE